MKIWTVDDICRALAFETEHPKEFVSAQDFIQKTQELELEVNRLNAEINKLSKPIINLPPPPPPPPPAPNPTSAQWLNRKSTLYVYGTVLTGTSVIEINGVAVSRMVYETRDQMSDGSYERIGFLARGKNKRLIPKGAPLVITVYEPTTLQRSAPITFIR